MPPRARRVMRKMDTHEFLAELHARLRPRTYLEVGVRAGRSLALSSARSIGIDPDFRVIFELSGSHRLVRSTSDEYFTTTDPKKWLGGPIELALIDGMHLFEFALRDFINIEKHSRWSSVVVLDDMLPRSDDEAARDRHTSQWTGDVFRLALVLRDLRPDLVVLRIDAAPTGLVLVTGLDPDSHVLESRYDEILENYMQPDPQAVPAEVLERKDAWDARRLLSLPVWGALHRGAWPLHPRAKGLAEIREAIENPHGYRRRRRAMREKAQATVASLRGRGTAPRR